MSLGYSLVKEEDGSSHITVFVPGRDPFPARSDHPNFEKIVAGALAGDEKIIDLFDIALSAGMKLQPLTDRILVSNGWLYFDGELIDNSLAQEIIRFFKEGVDDWKPLVNFFENIQQNPNEHSREHLYRWIVSHKLTITEAGMVVAYKGVNKGRSDTDPYLSNNQGKAIVNGEVKEGKIPNPIGGIVEMPRSEVVFDPNHGCSVGLHVATFNFARSFIPGGTVLEVHVNPRDVVSVPHGDDKMRVCRYRIIKVVTGPIEKAVVPDFKDKPKRAEPVAQYQKIKKTTVKKGDVFESTDSRRRSKFTVEKIEGEFAIGKSSSPQGSVTRKIKLYRLNSSKYKKVS